MLYIIFNYKSKLLKSLIKKEILLVFISQYINLSKIILFLIMQFNKIKFSSNNLIFLLLLSIPICAIAGNLLINLNIILTSIIGIFIIIKDKDYAFIKEYSELFLVVFFFFIIFSITIFFQITLIKTFLLIKFLFYTITIVYFLKKNEGVLLKIFQFYGIVCLILSVDIIFQSYFSINILGFENKYEYNSSFYGEEKLAGFHILFFSFFAIFFLPNILKKSFYRNLLLLILLIIIPFSIYLSLNRISLITYLLGLVFFFILSDARAKILTTFSLLIFIFLAFNHPDQKYAKSYHGFFNHGTIIIEKTFESYSNNKVINDKRNNNSKKIDEINKNRYTGSGHAVLFGNALYIWEKNKLFGVGYKQFYKKCRELKSNICSTHPHNIYLDILVSFGLLGIFSFIILLMSLLKKSIKIIFIKNNKNNIVNCFFITNIMFFFPFLSSGSILKSYLGFFAFTLIAFSIFIFNNKKLKI